MRISVVLAIHNGQAFLKEQLISLRDQTRQIHEYIIVDDASTDDSISIVREHLPTNETKIISNSSNQGPVKAFEKGIKKSSGDICFLCDQDDIWLPNKVEEFYQVFRQGAHFVFSDAELIDENGSELNKSFIDSLGFTPKEKIQLLEYKSDIVLSKKNAVSGACCAFLKDELKKEFYPFIYGERHMLHDRYLASLFASSDPSKVTFLPNPLIKYRIHENQFMGLNTGNENLDNSKEEYFNAEARLLEHTLSKVDNPHFRRAHYFWFMRSQLHKLPFLRKFISINTMFLEGDYKRMCKRPLKEVFGDLFG